jgi:hypothetical protein
MLRGVYPERSEWAQHDRFRFFHTFKASGRIRHAREFLDYVSLKVEGAADRGLKMLL